MAIQWKIIGFAAIAIAWLAGMFVDILEVDSAQYASMSQWIVQSGDFLHLTDLDQPYLDKPPLIFWCTALFYKIFGVSNFTFRLPSVLFGILAIYSTYRLSLLFYSRQTAIAAAMVLATAQCFFTMNVDVKTDMYLLGAVMFAIWQLVEHLETRKWMNLFAGFFGLGLAMLAKGPVGVMIPALAIGFDRALRRQWRDIFNWRWLVGFPVFGLVILPFCIGLYQQFGGEGIKFFFWTQSFGRVTGESSWANNTGPFFLVGTFLWAFLPWTILFIPAIGRFLQEVIVTRFRLGTLQEGIALGGFLLTFLGLSMSKFKLPHYIYVVMPFAAIMVAVFIEKITLEATRRLTARRWSNFQFGFSLLLFIAGSGLVIWAFAGLAWWQAILGLAALAGIFISFQQCRTHFSRLIIPSVIAIAGANFLLNSQAYPTILGYQATGEIGKRLARGEYPDEKFYTFGAFGRAMDVYAHHIVPTIYSEDDGLEKLKKAGGELYIFTQEKYLEELRRIFMEVQPLDTLLYQHPGKLKFKFINPSTRDEVAKKYLVVKVTKD